MSPPTPVSQREEDLAAKPGPANEQVDAADGGPHRGAVLTGEDGADGRKAFYIHVEARPGMEEQVVAMLGDIFRCVLDEPATGPWFAVRYSTTTFGIFEAFPDLSGRNAHVAGGGGDIFHDLERMNRLLARPAHVFRLDVLLSKEAFAS